MMPDQPTRKSKLTWDALIDEAATIRPGSATIEAIRRMVVALEQSEKSGTALGRRLKTLNVWLVILTAVLVFLTAAQACIAFAMWKGIQ
jgi:hypothetical protein